MLFLMMVVAMLRLTHGMKSLDLSGDFDDFVNHSLQWLKEDKISNLEDLQKLVGAYWGKCLEYMMPIVEARWAYIDTTGSKTACPSLKNSGLKEDGKKCTLCGFAFYTFPKWVENWHSETISKQKPPASTPATTVAEFHEAFKQGFVYSHDEFKNQLKEGDRRLWIAFFKWRENLKKVFLYVKHLQSPEMTTEQIDEYFFEGACLGMYQKQKEPPLIKCWRLIVNINTAACKVQDLMSKPPAGQAQDSSSMLSPWLLLLLLPFLGYFLTVVLGYAKWTPWT